MGQDHAIDAAHRRLPGRALARTGAALAGAADDEDDFWNATVP